MRISPARLKRILALALPIMGGMVSQNIMNLADTAMVGRLGKESLAAVGFASFATFVAQSFLMGLSSGVQTMAARRKGEGRESDMALPLNGGLLLAFGLGLPIAAIAKVFAGPLFRLLTNDAAVWEVGVPYFEIRLLGVVAVACNFSFRGYWNGVSLSHVYLRTLVLMHAVNLLLNYLLIFGNFGFPELGATGAAIGTTLSTYVGTAAYVAMALRWARGAGFGRAAPDAQALGAMLRLSVPNGIQQLFFSCGLLALFWMIGRVGTSEVAAANLIINVALVGILPGLGLGLAAMSLVGQSLGRGDPEDARLWGWDVCRLGLLLIGFVAAPMMVVPELILSLLVGGDAEVARAASGALRVAGVGLLFDAVGVVLMNALLGAGDTRRVAFVSIGLQWVVFLPLVYLVGPGLGGGLLEIWLVQASSRAAQALVFAWIWRGPSWQAIRV